MNELLHIALSRPFRYVLDDGKPVAEPDIERWGRWMATAERHVGDHVVNGAYVSTVFLGVDHRRVGDGPPILWETMIFGGEYDEFQKRYSSREAAVQGHAEAVAMVRGEA